MLSNSTGLYNKLCPSAHCEILPLAQLLLEKYWLLILPSPNSPIMKSLLFKIS